MPLLESRKLRSLKIFAASLILAILGASVWIQFPTLRLPVPRSVWSHLIQHEWITSQDGLQDLMWFIHFLVVLIFSIALGAIIAHKWNMHKTSLK